MKPGCLITLGVVFWFIQLSSSVPLNASCIPLKISAFNIQIFGVTKASKSDVMSILANITRRYDIMVIQEIRDSSMTAIYQLLDLVNSIANVTDGGVYAMELSARTGRSSSKEQYSFFYRESRVRVVATHQFNDTVGDVFEREPFSVLFQRNCSANVSACERFWLQVIHIRPTDAVSEMNALYQYSFPAARAAFNTSQGMVLGDLNGDCSYVSDTAALSLKFTLDSGFTFLLSKGVIDTTVSSTFCTYDNFIIHSNLSQFLIPGSASIFNFMSVYGLTQDFAEDVSDHYPIELQLALDCSQIPTLQPTMSPTIPSKANLTGNCSVLKISAFNIQIFGVTKASKSDVMSILANITRRYDIMVIQEIRDSSMTAIYQLLDLVNSIANVTDGGVYAMELSARTGRSSSKEQYSFFYRESRVRVVATHQFNDTVGDVFEREPFSVLFQRNCSANVSACERFWLQVIHIKPTDAVSEMNALYQYSFPAARAAFNTSQGMVLGDLNGDCSYVSDTAALSLDFTLDSDFTFLLSKGVIDTTVSSTFCTYDNFIIHSNLSQFLIPGSASIFNFMSVYGLTQDFAEDVSDHYPIELQLALDCSQIPTLQPTMSPTIPSKANLTGNCSVLKISAFNIQIFGVTKASKSDVMSILANITRRYDIMVIQEIRDSSMTAIYQLLDLVNSIANVTDGGVYAMELSARTGRSSSKEQYSFFYRESRVRVVATHQFNDTVGDVFEREPFSVLFQRNCSANVSACERFWLQVIHIKPTDAVSEMNALYQYSFPAARAAFNTSQGMVLGDLNGDCSYVSDTAALSLKFTLDSDFTFLLSKGVIDTTVSSTFCTYDNFIIHSNLSQFLIPGSASIFNFMSVYGLTQDFAEDVSDHYPIELQLALDCQVLTSPLTSPPTNPTTASLSGAAVVFRNSFQLLLLVSLVASMLLFYNVL